MCTPLEYIYIHALQFCFPFTGPHVHLLHIILGINMFLTELINSKDTMKMAVFWDVAPCNLVDIDRRFRETYCLHHQGDGPNYIAPHPRRQPSSYSSP
jgi:hypothetical protein